MSHPGFVARYATRSHQVTLNSPSDTLFPLFGPLREGEWLAGFEPEVVAGDAATARPGCVFRTTPTRDITRITIDVSPAGPGRCTALVT